MDIIHVASLIFTGVNDGWSEKHTRDTTNALEQIVNHPAFSGYYVNCNNGKNDPLSYYLAFLTQESVQNSVKSIIERAKQAQKGYEGRLEVRVSVNVNRARIEIEDNGLGVSADLVDKLFLQTIGKSNEDGNGLYRKDGCFLFIAAKMIKMIGGNFGYAGTPGEFTKFWYELPVLRNQV